MDPRRFEELSRRVGTAATRRAALRALAGGVAAAAVGLLRSGQAGAEEVVITTSIPIAHCRFTLVKCHDDRQCCSGKCRKNFTAEVGELPPIDLEGVCACRESGETCYRLLEGVMCCSGRCTNEAKCA